MALIRAFFGVEREFDRYYLRLKEILKGNYPQLGRKQLMKKAMSKNSHLRLHKHIDQELIEGNEE